MAVCYGGETWGVQSLSMGIVPLALRCSLHAVTSRLWGTVHDPWHKDRSHVSTFDRIAFSVSPVVSFGAPCPSVPAKHDLEQAIPHTGAYAQEGYHTVMPCSAGSGRTGLCTAYVAKRCFGLSGAEAIQGGRHSIPHAVETEQPYRLVLDDDARRGLASVPCTPHEPGSCIIR
jgi:hypothetical protein